MCFVLYAGTLSPLPRKAWDKNAPDISVVSLTERDSPIKVHFSKPEIQYIGSTSDCGCDFPFVMFQNGGWPWFDNGEADAEMEASDRYNRQALASLLRASGERAIELYGVWDGDFLTPPLAREEISAETLAGPKFRFKEGGFYLVRLGAD